MAAINFPNSPQTNDTHTVGSLNYVYDGTKWIGGGNSPVDKIYEDDSKAEIVDAGGSSGYFIVSPEGNEAFRVNSSGNLLFNNFPTTSSIGGQSSAGVLKIFGGATNQGGQIDLLGGNTEDGIIKFRTGAGSGEQTEKVRITADGYVSIGETTAAFVSRRLYVAGSEATAYSSSDGSNNAYLRLINKDGTDNTGVNNHVGIEMYVATGATTVGMLSMVRTGNNIGDFTYKTRTGANTYAEHFRITSDGNIGIGTDNPSAKLDVRGTLGISNTDDTFVRTTITSSAGGLIVNHNDNSPTIFQNQGAEKLRITSGGAVNIGDVWADDSDPMAYITKNADVGSIVLKGNGTGTNNAFAIYGGGWSGSTDNKFAIRADGSVWGGQTSLRFGTGSTYTERLRILSTGAVRIGGQTDPIDIVKQSSNNGTLSFEGSAGQLFSITNNLTSGSLFSVNDVSGLPSIDVDAGGDILIAPYSGNVGVGVTSTPAYKLEVNGSFAATTKSFVINHPTKPGMKLRYGSLEGPENGVYVRGKTSEFIVELPNYWTGLIDEDTITVNLTPIGKTQTLWVQSIEDNKVTIGSKCTEVEYFYTIYGERKDVEKLEVEIS